MTNTEPKRNARGDTFVESKMRHAMNHIDAIRDSGDPDTIIALYRISEYAQKARARVLSTETQGDDTNART